MILFSVGLALGAVFGYTLCALISCGGDRDV